MSQSRKKQIVKRNELVELVLFQGSFYDQIDKKSEPVNLQPIGLPSLICIGNTEQHKVEAVNDLSKDYPEANAYMINREVGLAPSLWLWHPIQFYKTSRQS